MTSYFDEKASQVEPGSLVAFGINIISRYSRADELIEMLSFAKQAALAGVADAIEKAYYDSNACICSFKFSREIALGDATEKKLFAAAIGTSGQFDWFDTVHHSGDEDE